MHPTKVLLRSLLISALLVIFASVSPTIGWCQQQTNVEKQTRIVSMASPEGDPTLAKQVAVNLLKTSLPDTLEFLNNKTNARLLLTPSQPWLKEIHNTIITRQMPLHLVLRRLASLHSLTWYAETSAGSKEVRYILQETTSNSTYIAKLQNEAQNTLLRFNKTLLKYLSYSPNELKELSSQRDIIATKLLEPGARDYALLLTRLPDTALMKISKGRSITQSYKNLDASAQETMSRLFVVYERQNIARHDALIEEGLVKGPYRSALYPIEEFTIRYRAEGVGAVRDLRIIFDNAKVVFASSFITPDHNSSEKLWLPEKSRSGSIGLPVKLKLNSRTNPRELQLETTNFSEYLQIIASKYSLNIFADDYPLLGNLERNENIHHLPIEQGATLVQVTGRSTWWSRAHWQEGTIGQDVLFLHRDWFEFRDKGKWTSILKKMKEKDTKKDALTFEDWVQIHTLSDTQYYYLHKALKKEPEYLRGNRDVLTFYASLRKRDQQQLAGGGLPRSILSSVSKELFDDVVQSSGAAVVPEIYERLVLKLEVKPNGISQFILGYQNNREWNTLKAWSIAGKPVWYTAKKR